MTQPVVSPSDAHDICVPRYGLTPDAAIALDDIPAEYAAAPRWCCVAVDAGQPYHGGTEIYASPDGEIIQPHQLSHRDDPSLYTLPDCRAAARDNGWGIAALQGLESPAIHRMWRAASAGQLAEPDTPTLAQLLQAPYPPPGQRYCQSRVTATPLVVIQPPRTRWPALDPAWEIPVPQGGLRDRNRYDRPRVAVTAVPAAYARQSRWCCVRRAPRPDGYGDLTYVTPLGLDIDPADITTGDLSSLPDCLAAASQEGWGIALSHAVDPHTVHEMWRHCEDVVRRAANPRETARNRHHASDCIDHHPEAIELYPSRPYEPTPVWPGPYYHGLTLSAMLAAGPGSMLQVVTAPAAPPLRERAPDRPSSGAAWFAAGRPAAKPPVIAGLARPGDVVNLVAAAKIGKSHLVGQLSLAVATGSDWLGRACSSGRVLIVDYESRPDELWDRLGTQAAALHLPDGWREQIEAVTCLDRPWPTDAVARYVAQAARRGEHYAAVVVDVLRAALDPAADENSSRDMRAAYRPLRQLAAETGAVVVVVHHVAKGDQSRVSVVDRGAGSGALAGMANAHVTVTLRGRAARLDAAIRAMPSIDGQRLVYGWPLWRLDAATDADAIAEQPAAADTGAASVLAAVAALAAAGTPATQSALVRHLGCNSGRGKDHLRTMLDALVRQGRIVAATTQVRGRPRDVWQIAAPQ